MNNRNKINTYSLLFMGIYLLVWIFLFWRCRFGFAYEDETFYLTIPYRFCLGDKLLLHEWHLSQLSGILLLPFMKLYLAIARNTDGVILFFRYLFTIVWGFGGLFFWYKLKRFSFAGAAAAALCFVVYAPWGIMALSYQSMSFLLLAAACVILITDDRKPRLIAAGVLYSGSVLCNPYLAVLYPLYALLALALLVVKKKDKALCGVFFTVGILAVLIPFCIYLLLSATFKEYLRVLPFVLDDPEHPMHSSLLRNFINTVKYCIYLAQNMNRYWKICVFAAAVVSVFGALTRMYKLGFILICADVIFLLLTYHFGYHIMNFYMFPASFLGAYGFLCSRDRVIKTLFCGLWLPGFVYAFCHMFASNQRYLAFAHASGVMMIAGIVIAGRFVFLCNQGSGKKWGAVAVTGAFCMLIVCQLSCELSSRYRQFFWDWDIQYQTILAESGPDKGIRLSSDAHEFYQLTQEDIRIMCDGDNVREVLFVSELPWLYLVAQKDFAAYSAWIPPINGHTVEKLRAYYSLFPDKKPDAIYFDRDYFELMPEFEKDG